MHVNHPALLRLRARAEQFRGRAGRGADFGLQRVCGNLDQRLRGRLRIEQETLGWIRGLVRLSRDTAGGCLSAAAPWQIFPRWPSPGTCQAGRRHAGRRGVLLRSGALLESRKRCGCWAFRGAKLRKLACDEEFRLPLADLLKARSQPIAPGKASLLRGRERRHHQYRSCGPAAGVGRVLPGSRSMAARGWRVWGRGGDLLKAASECWGGWSWPIRCRSTRTSGSSSPSSAAASCCAITPAARRV